LNGSLINAKSGSVEIRYTKVRDIIHISNSSINIENNKISESDGIGEVKIILEENDDDVEFYNISGVNAVGNYSFLIIENFDFNVKNNFQDFHGFFFIKGLSKLVVKDCHFKSVITVIRPFIFLTNGHVIVKDCDNIEWSKRICFLL
jgi:hypothetical protein